MSENNKNGPGANPDQDKPSDINRGTISKSNYTPQIVENQTEFDLHASKLAQQYQELSPENKRDFNYLLLHEDQIPPITTGSDSWNPYTMANVYQDRPPSVFLADGILELPSLNILYGAPGTLKSFILQDLAVCVAMGKPWLEKAAWSESGRSIPTTQAPILWVDFDNGAKRTLDRFKALGIHHKAPIDAPIKIYTMANPPLDATDPAHIATMATRAFGSKLIVIDNLGTISGGMEENSSGMIQVMYNLRWLAETTGAAVVIIHHQRKTGAIGMRAGDSLRGHSSIEAALDLALKIEREQYSERVTIESTKTRGVEVEPFTACFTYDQELNGELKTAAFFSVESDDNKSNQAIDREIKAALNSGPMIQSSLWQAVKMQLPEIGKNRILDQIRKLETAGKLDLTIGINNSKTYGLPVYRGLPGFTGKPKTS